MNKAFLILLFFISIPFPVFAKTVTPSQVILGSYDAEESYPLFLTNNNSENAWTATTNVSGLSNNGFSLYEMNNSLSCTQSFCVAVGRDDTGNGSPVILQSYDKGKSWNVVKNISSLPEKSYLEVSSVSCTNSNSCIIAGDYGRLKVKHPLLITTNDAGKTWTAKQDFGTTTPGILKNVFCDQKNCLATGYPLEKGYTPFVFTSNDTGQSWKNINTKELFASDTPRLSTSYCKNKNCFILGVSGSYPSVKPILWQSHDAGNTWSNAKNFPTLPAKSNLNGLNCSDSLCVIGVQNYNAPASKYPHLLISRDNGDSWKAVDAIHGMPQDTSYMTVNVINCENTFCTLMGNLGNELYDSIPYTLISKDKGTTWSFENNIDGIPEGYNQIDGRDLQCTNQQCTVVGGYAYNSDAEEYNPLLMTSNDRGSSWAIVKTIPNMPAMNSGALNAIQSAT